MGFQKWLSKRSPGIGKALEVKIWRFQNSWWAVRGRQKGHLKGGVGCCARLGYRPPPPFKRMPRSGLVRRVGRA